MIGSAPAPLQKQKPVKTVAKKITGKATKVSVKDKGKLKQRLQDIIKSEKGKAITLKNIMNTLVKNNLIPTTINQAQFTTAFALTNYNSNKVSSPDGSSPKIVLGLGVKTNLRDLLEQLTPDDQCKLHMPDYFEGALRTQVVSYLEAALGALPIYSQFKVLKGAQGALEQWITTNGGIDLLTQAINKQIKIFINSSPSRELPITITLPSRATATINFRVCEERDPTNPLAFSEYYNTSLALYGLYNKPASYTFDGKPYNFNLGNCWLCGEPIAIFTGFGTLMRSKPSLNSYGLICTGLGECEHVFPVIDAAKFGALVDRVQQGVNGEYYPSHTHCNQVKNDAQLWFKDLKKKIISPSPFKVQNLLREIKEKSTNKNEKNAHLQTLINRAHPSVDSAWETQVITTLFLSINEVSKRIPNFKIIASTLDKQIESAQCFYNIMGYIETVKLTKEQVDRKGGRGGRGGGISIEDDKREIGEVLRDPGNLLISQIKYETLVDDSTELSIIGNIFNKIILSDIGIDSINEYIASELTDTSISIQDIESIFANNYYIPITEYPVDTNTESYKKMQEIITNKDTTEDDREELLDLLQQDNPALTDSTIEIISLAIDSINLDIVNTILSSIIVKLSSVLVIINNYGVYITNIKDIGNYDETKYIEILDNHFTYNETSYDVNDVVLGKTLLDGNQIIPLILSTELAELKKKEIEDVLNVLDGYNQIADISRNTVSDPIMITDAIQEQETDINKSITDLQTIDPSLASELESGLYFLLENFNIDYEGPVKKSASEKLESNLAKGITLKQRTLTLEQIQSYIDSNKQKFSEVCNIDLPIKLDNSGNICQNINGEQVKIDETLIMDIIRNDLCKEYSNISYDQKRTRLNCSNNTGGKTKKTLLKYNRTKKQKNKKIRKTKKRNLKRKRSTRRI